MMKHNVMPILIVVIKRNVFRTIVLTLVGLIDVEITQFVNREATKYSVVVLRDMLEIQELNAQTVSKINDY